MNNISGKISIELLDNSIETITGVENLLNSSSIADNFEELESYFKKINFEHSNCLSYKISLDSIYNDLQEIKKIINNLSDFLRTTKNSYSEVETLSSTDRKEIYSDKSDSKFNMLQGIKTSMDDTSDSNITRIDPPPKETTIEKKPYSTVPIGLAIGATGIAGSVGAVVVNEKYGPEIAESEVEEYHDLSDDTSDFEVDEYPKIKEEDVAPYHASRDSREADKYYGSNNDDLKLDEYDDDDIYDDFDE